MFRRGLPLLLAVVTFLVYIPSLSSGLVYDAWLEINEEGFITKLANLPAVLTLHVLATHLTLAQRPGEMLYLMLIAAVNGRHPFAYHLCSNLLHAANVALLFVLLRRLCASETDRMARNAIDLPIAAAVLVFAVHPMAVEPVAGVSYSSDLLVAFFTLLALLIATAFPTKDSRKALGLGCAGTFCAFAATTCKESGVAVSFLLVAYWFLYRRRDDLWPWMLYISGAFAATLAFLAARFYFALPAVHPMPYLGGSFWQVLLIQPRLWVFMLGKLCWPTGLSADYTLDDMPLPSLPVAILVLALVVGFQGWLAVKSRIASLGMAIFWLGLATVSNLMPLNRILADRFYYLPLAGVAMELLALLLLVSTWPQGFRALLAVLAIALIPCVALTLQRQAVFSSNLALWTDTVRVSPHSYEAYDGLGLEYAHLGRAEQAADDYRRALALNPVFPQAHYNLGILLYHTGHVEEAMKEYRTAFALKPDYTGAYCNLGMVLLQRGEIQPAIALFRKTLEIDPNFVQALNNLGVALTRLGRNEEAIPEFEKSLVGDPEESQIHYNLAGALAKVGRIDEAFAEYRAALKLRPDYAQAMNNFGILLLQQRQPEEALEQFQRAVEVAPDNVEAQSNLALTLTKLGRLDEALAQYRQILANHPGLADVLSNYGFALLQAGQVGPAISELNAALKIEPDLAEARSNLARARATQAAHPAAR